jgi:hypothetical protein
MAKLAHDKKKKETPKVDTCYGCKHYSFDVQKASMPVMQTRPFQKVTMRCHSEGILKLLNEKYENTYPSEERVKSISPQRCVAGYELS